MKARVHSHGRPQMRRFIVLCAVLLTSTASAWSDSRQDCFLEKDDPDRAVQGCSDVLAGLLKMASVPPQMVQAVYTRRAQAYAAKSDFEHAIADYTEAIRIKEEAGAYHRRGDLYRKLKQFDLAIADYDKAAALNPKSTGALFARASTYDEMADEERAVAAYAKLLEIDPTDETVWSIWKSRSSNICVSGKDSAAAIRACSALISVPEQHRDPPQRIAEIYFLRGSRLDESGATKQALADYTASIRLDPQNARPYKMRAIFYFNQKQPALAITDLSAAIELNPRDADLYKLRGSIHLAESQFDRAIGDFNRASALKPQDAGILVQRARALAGKGDKNRAVEDYRKALELNPADEHAREELQRLVPR